MKTAFLILSLSTLLARAGLEFEAISVERTAQHSDTEVAVDFKFKVTGDKPITISEIQTYCSCLKAKTKGDKKVYQPGEEGVVETAFQLGTFEGSVPKQVKVASDDAAKPEIELTVTVNIPVLYQVEPSKVSWTVGEAPAAKTMKVTILGEKDIHVTGTVSSREGMTVTTREMKPGREYELTFTPKTTAEPMLGLLRVETDAPYPRYQKKLLFFNIVRAAAPAGK